MTAVKLKLPKTLHIHPVVNISRVKPYLGPLPGQPVPRPGPIHVTEDHNEQYEVDAIVDSRIYKGKLQYLVHWKGYDESKQTWVQLHQSLSLGTVHELWRLGWAER